MFLCVGIALAQTPVKGVVVSAEDNEPVIGATVKVAGSQTGTVTDMNGEFSLNVAPGARLEVSYVGMITKAVKASQNMRIALESDAQAIDEVMVVAYGSAKKSAFTGSASVIKSEELGKRQASDITKTLSGSVAGVQVLSSNGQPGVSSNVRIRGIGSINAGTNPLYVVDGVPYDLDLSSINTQDIESMTVLKDAAAAALYGARGANGVILITTKKGQRGEPTISLDARLGSNSRQIGKYDVMEGPAEYYETLYKARYNQAYYNQNLSPEAANMAANSQLFSATGYQIYTLPAGEGLIGMDGKINPNAKLGYSDGQYYYTPDDWTKGTIDNQTRQEYNLGISGSTDKMNYYLSAGYLDDGGVIENSGFKRISSRIKVDYQLKKWLKIGTNLSYNYNKSRYPDEQTNASGSGNAFLLANEIAPIYPMYVRNADGSLMYDKSTGNVVYDYGNSALPNQTNCSRNWMSSSNPMSDLIYNTEEYLMDIFSTRWFAELTPIEGLKLTASLGVDIDNTRTHLISNKLYGQSASYGGQIMQEHRRTSGLNQQYLANYRREFGQHHADILLGYESYDYRYENSYAIGSNYYKENDFTVNNTIDQIRGGGSATEYSTRGIFGRINYDFDEKYFGSVSYRRDASSRFHPDNRWGDFWSASAAWVISKEKFMENVKWVDMLKFKASYGQQGNDDLRDTQGYKNYYPYIDQYQVTGADGVFSDGTLYYKGNKDITWETSHSFNIGFDFSLLKNKLSGTIEYFSRKSSDMLYNKPVASSNGYSSIPMNVGSMKNYGLEVELKYTPIQTKNLTWDIFGNITQINNKVIELHPDLGGELINGSRIYREGESMYQLYLVKYAGVDAATGKPLYWAKPQIEDEEGNLVTVEDGEEYATPDWSVASATNKQSTGNTMPKVYGGFGTSVDFYGFDFSIQFAYQMGGKIWDYTYQDLMHNGNSNGAGRNWHKDIANAWTPTNTNTDVPRLCSSDEYTNASSDRWLISSNYLALNNITLGYTLPKSLLSGAGIQSVRVYFAADNIAVWAARKGLDPRQGYVTSENATYGALRSLSAGLKVVF
jgi:TonB-linked outer membrane protein, SusC/RagA family/TonB-dependent outer membrane receptor, SusC/RagA subfamily, signature region